jgi:hypothetical protein
MPTNPQRLRAEGYRNFLVVLVLVIVSWAVPITGAFLLFGC